MPKTIDHITQIALKKIQMLILFELPEPTCPQKKEQWRWKVEQVKKKIVNDLYPQNNGINIEIKVDEQIFIVTGVWDHEGSDVLGVFDTLEKAKDFADENKSQKHFPYDYIEVYESELNSGNVNEVK